MKTKKENKNPVSMESLNWRQLTTGMTFNVFCQKEPTPNNPESYVEVWQFKVKEVLSPKEVVKVAVVFPTTGREEIAFFEEVETGGVLQVYFDPEKTGYFMGWDVIDILWN